MLTEETAAVDLVVKLGEPLGGEAEDGRVAAAVSLPSSGMVLELLASEPGGIFIESVACSALLMTPPLCRPNNPKCRKLSLPWQDC